MKSFSFVHLADIHLGYRQYGLEARRRDFSRVFEEAVDRILELRPDFAIIAGDFFNDPRPANPTLGETISSLRRLRDANIPVLIVDGSHDTAPNIVTETILSPLDEAGLVYYLPIHDGACWENEYCYVFGIPSFLGVRRKESLSDFYLKNRPLPREEKFNIFAFHGAVGLPEIREIVVKAEFKPKDIPDGFDYYAGGHIHSPIRLIFKNGLLVYSGCTETTAYEEAIIEKGFFYVQVNGKREPTVQRINLESPRRFKIIREDFSGMMPNKITNEAINIVKRADESGIILVLVLEGTLPREMRRGSVNIAKIRKEAQYALHLRVINRLKETVPIKEVEEVIFARGRDIRTRAYQLFLDIFVERYGRREGEEMAKLALSLLAPLVQGREKTVKELLESVV